MLAWSQCVVAASLAACLQGCAASPPAIRPVNLTEAANRHGSEFAARRPAKGRVSAELPGARDLQRAQAALLDRGNGAPSRTAGLYRKAAEKGNSVAAFNLAYIYENGIGVPRNPQDAYRWYRRAAATSTSASLRNMAASGADRLQQDLGALPDASALTASRIK